MMAGVTRLTCLLTLILFAGCGSGPSSSSTSDKAKDERASPKNTKAVAPVVPATAEKLDERPVIICFGDSLSAGYGVDAGLSYPDFLQKEIDAAGYRYRVVNQGISGDTSAGGRARIQSALDLKPQIIVVELGGNDGLRALPLEQTQANLDAIVGAFRKAGVRVLLSGMTLPPNYGPDYIKGFEQTYRDLRKKYNTSYLRFLLDGVYDKPGMMQDDGIHATAEGNKIVAHNVFLAMRPLLKK